jgi:hypothetical protein
LSLSRALAVLKYAPAANPPSTQPAPEAGD